MLIQLCIQNFAVISELELELKSGMTVLTGETGAGKSILIDALLLALGGRADNTCIQNGQDRCIISAAFDIQTLNAANQWLQQQELQQDNECVLRRIITSDGRSRGFINGQPVTIQTLRELGNLLISIHGQHEHQTLLKPDKQRILLDLYGGHITLAKKVNDLYQQWHKTREELQHLIALSAQRTAKQDLLTYQVQELDQLALQENELMQLDQEQKQLANADHLLENCQNALNYLSDNEENNVLNFLNAAQQQLNHLKKFDKQLDNTSDLLNNAEIQLQEASNELRNYLEHIELDPERLSQVEQRLSIIHEIARKHHVPPKEIIHLHQQLRTELDQLTHSDAHLKNLEQQLLNLANEYQTTAQELSRARHNAAAKLAPQIEKSIQQLGMPNGKFTVQFETTKEFSAHGLEKLEFYVSTNPGQTLQPLAKIVSGGELSRISLAIHVLTAKNDAKPTLIFDEVDVGIGGGTAEIVGRLLRSLSKSAQILCVTHLPQVAALGHQHLQIKKIVKKNSTQIAVTELDNNAKIQEIARMLGGVKVTEQTLAHASEMVISGSL